MFQNPIKQRKSAIKHTRNQVNSGTLSQKPRKAVKGQQ